jgi:hypothetical protein
MLAKTKAGWVASNEIPLEVKHRPRVLMEKIVPPANRRGIFGNVLPPGDSSYAGQLDMESVSFAALGPDLEISVQMKAVTNVWNAPYGYDHVYFNVFLDLPGRKGQGFLPKLGWCPGGFRFRLGFLFYGWGIVPYSAADSTPDAYGPPLSEKIEQETDACARVIRFRFPGELFGGMDFSQLKVFISTWDGYLGKFQEISSRRQDWTFSVKGSMSPRGVPKIYNHLLVDMKETRQCT